MCALRRETEEVPATTSRYDPTAEPTIWRVPDDLWEESRPILGQEKPAGTPGRPAVPDRRVLDGILYVLRTGCQWKAVPQEFGSGSTCHRRFQEWVAGGTWERLWADQLRRDDAAHGIGWDRQSADSASVPSPPRRRRDGAGPHQPRQARHETPHPRRSPGGAAGRGGQRGQPPRQEAGRGHPRQRGPAPARRHPARRWVVERTNSRHNRFRKPRIRYEKQAANDLGLVRFACFLMVYRLRQVLG